MALARLKWCQSRLNMTPSGGGISEDYEVPAGPYTPGCPSNDESKSRVTCVAVMRQNELPAVRSRNGFSVPSRI